MRDFKLYVILDTQVCAEPGKLLAIARKTIVSGADILQLRAKDWPDRRIVETGRALKKIIAGKKTLFILNDRADLARIIGAQGVHLGQDDLAVTDARRIIGSKKIIGLSTHSLEQVRRVKKGTCDYLAIGPIFPTATKPDMPALTPEILPAVKREAKIPVFAVGGINLDNLQRILNAGAKRIALCRAIITAGDVSGRTREFKQRLS